MKHISTLRRLIAGIALVAGISPALNAQFTQNFDDINTLAGAGWFLQNNSAPLGITSWFQGTSVAGGGPFDAYNGAANSYIGANFNNTTGGAGIISTWLLTPNLTLRNGDVITFYTRRPTTPGGGTEYPDRLEVRMSTNGASTNIGAAGNNVGDFTTLLLSVNPSLVTNVYPAVWTQYTATVSGLSAPTSGRLAFRYFVTGAGPTGTNSDYIGIDNVVYTPYVCPTLTISPSTIPGGTAGTAYSQTLSQTGALGAPGYAVIAGALPPGLTLSTSGTISGTPTATGTFNFTVGMADASGCSTTRAYSLTVICPANPITFSTPPSLCSNGSPITLTQGSPAGGTYSGTGVSGGQFNPSSGTQTITYDFTDAYGCAHSSNFTATVNTAPTVTLSSFTPACIDAAPVTLTGGSPAGGTYSGTGVTGGSFDPSAGTQTITYQYTDGNNCSNSATGTFTVNTLPVVTLSSFTAVCSNAADVTLSGGSPAGGTYIGTGVTGGDFDPSVGTQDIVYSYTDGNGCANTDTSSFPVNMAPTVTLSSFTAICGNAADVTLTGGSPAGGTYSGTGVTGGDFDPSAGTQDIVYSYTDGNGCSSSDTASITVNTAPTVTLSSLGTVCDDAGPVALNGGLPSGGTYSGTGVSGTTFSPSAGTQSITYTYTDGNGCSDNASQTITVISCLGVEEVEAYSLQCFPNPNDGNFSVRFTMENEGDVTIHVLTLDGKSIYVQQLNNISGTYTHTINLGSLAKGNYLLELNGTNGKAYKRIIVQ